MALSKNDPSSFSNSEAFKTLHQTLDLVIDFKSKVVRGSTKLSLEAISEDAKIMVKCIIAHFRFPVPCRHSLL